MWKSGDQVVLRYRVDGRFRLAMPVIVVDDSSDCIALFRAVDTQIKQAVQPDGSPIPRSWSYEQRFRVPWRLGDGVWHSEATLTVARPGAAHAVSLFWNSADWTFHGWYIDLQAPFRRTVLGFESEDHVLDIVVRPDHRWYWKDQDEFAVAQRLQRFSPAQAKAVHDEALSVVAAIESWSWPFDAGWEQWRPDPGWTVPSLPEDWDR